MADQQLLEGRGALVYRMRPGASPPHEVVVMLHGLSGDERAMWVLEAALPPSALVVAPRAPFPYSAGGFSWVPESRIGQTSLEDYLPAAVAVEALISQLELEFAIQRQEIYLMGFSQGAAVAIAAGMFSFRPAGVIILAGFVPPGDLTGLQDLPIYWGHGNQDQVIPLSRALEGAERLRDAGAALTFCASDVGHRLGLDCARSLKTWFPAG